MIEDPVWLSIAESEGLAGAHLVSYVYPPLIAALVAPLAEATSAAQLIQFGLFIQLGFCALPSIGRGPW